MFHGVDYLSTGKFCDRQTGASKDRTPNSASFLPHAMTLTSECEPDTLGSELHKGFPRLPEHLRLFENIQLEDFRKPWDHYRPLLNVYGIRLWGTPEYDEPCFEEFAPRKTASDPFHPKPDEDFLVHCEHFWLDRKYLKPCSYFQEVRSQVGHQRD